MGVQRQVSMSQKLMEVRIGLEAPLQVANRFPTKRKFQELRSDKGAEEILTQCRKEVRGLLSTLICIQEELDITPLPPRKRANVKDESEVWKSMMESQNDSLKDWGLQMADEWKEQTR